MMRWSAFIFAGLLVASLSSPEPALAQVTRLSYTSDPLDVVGEGRTGIFGSGDGTFDVRTAGPNGLTFHFTNAQADWTIELDARDFAPMLAGPYPGASDFRFHSPTKPGIRVTADGRSCDWSEGTFKILQIDVKSGAVQAFAADVDQHCSGTTANLHVELRYASATTFPPPPDGDLDGVPNTIDNCLNVRNQDQADDDFDLIGDLCDPRLDNTFLTLLSEPGDPLGQGKIVTFKLRDGTIRAQHNFQQQLLVEFDGDEDWSFYFEAPQGETLEPGLYQGALPPNAPGPELLVTRAGHDCPSPSGLFEIHHVVFDTNGVVSSLAVDFVQSCDGAPPLRGSIRYLSPDALMLRPEQGSTLDNSTVTFEWSDYVSSKKEFWIYIGTKFASPDILDSGSLGTRTSLVVSGLPADGRTLYVRLWARNAKGWKTADYQYTATTFTYVPAIVSPAPESTLPGPTVRFRWKANGLPVTNWMLNLGSRFGAWDLYKSSGLTTTEVDVTGLPTDGSTLFARLWFLANGVWDYEDFQFLTDASGGTPELIAPSTSETLPGAETTLQWDPKGSVVTNWMVYVGSTQGNWDLHKSASLTGSERTYDLTNLPTDGSTLYVRLWYCTGSWYYKDYQFTTADFGGVPALVSPANGAVLDGPDLALTWTPNGSKVSQWQVQVGTRFGAYDLHASPAIAGSATGYTVTGLPTDGSTIYLRLYYVAGVWHYLDYQFQASATGGKPELLTPVPGSTLTDSAATFSWKANGAVVSQWLLHIGSRVGGYDLLNTGSIPGDTTSMPVSGLPTDGRPIYVRLWYVNGSWNYIDYQLTASAAGGTPEILSPVAGSTLPSSDVQFQWTPNGSKVVSYRLLVGATRWGGELYDSGYFDAATTSKLVTGLPTDGSLLYVTLWYQTGGGTFYKEAVYTASSIGGTPHLLTPVPGSKLTGATVTFTWTAAGSVVKAYWLNIGNAPGTNDIYNSGQIAASQTSRQVMGLPTDGRVVWVQLWYQRDDNSWTRVDEWYTATGGGS